MPRRGYLDWLRGVAVLLMIEAHTFDAWTIPAERVRPEFGRAMTLGGMAAPLFLFMAGVAASLAAGGRARRMPASAAARTVARRGWQIFGLAFLFRLQSFLMNGARGSLVGLLKVDILNVMGPAIAATAGLWRIGRTPGGRLAVLGGATVAAAMLTPLVRTTGLLDWVPDPLEWYLRPAAGRTNFTLFPWAAFVLAGGALGVVLDRCATSRREVAANAGFLVVGSALVVAGRWLSYRPSIYAESHFWSTSPTFFCIRTGVLLVAVAAAYAWSRRPWPRLVRSPLEIAGVGSLFIYWVHVELVYGWPGAPLRRRLTVEEGLVAYLVFSAGMYGLLLLWNRVKPCRKPAVTT